MDQVAEHTVLPASPIRSAICSDMTSFPFSSNTTTCHTWKHQETKATDKSLSYARRKDRSHNRAHMSQGKKELKHTKSSDLSCCIIAASSASTCTFTSLKKASENNTDGGRTGI
jgi:hypothetical protein